jgi:hypothetical protein
VIAVVLLALTIRLDRMTPSAAKSQSSQAS